MTGLSDLNLPPELLVVLRRLPLIRGESQQEYEAFLAAIIRGLEPQDIPELLWIVQYAHASWEWIRCNSMRATVMHRNYTIALIKVLEGLRLPHRDCTGSERIEYAHKWKHDVSAVGLDHEMIQANSVILSAESVGFLESTMEKAESRSDKLLSLLEGRRELFVHRAKEHSMKTRMGRHELLRLERGSDETHTAVQKADVGLVPPPVDDVDDEQGEQD